MERILYQRAEKVEDNRALCAVRVMGMHGAFGFPSRPRRAARARPNAVCIRPSRTAVRTAPASVRMLTTALRTEL